MIDRITAIIRDELSHLLRAAAQRWKKGTGSGFEFQIGVVGDNARCRRSA